MRQFGQAPKAAELAYVSQFVGGHTPIRAGELAYTRNFGPANWRTHANSEWRIGVHPPIRAGELAYLRQFGPAFGVQTPVRSGELAYICQSEPRIGVHARIRAGEFSYLRQFRLFGPENRIS